MRMESAIALIVFYPDGRLQCILLLSRSDDESYPVTQSAHLFTLGGNPSHPETWMKANHTDRNIARAISQGLNAWHRDQPVET
jgi:hypothetical protein